MAICEKHGQYSVFCKMCDMDTITTDLVNKRLQDEDCCVVETHSLNILMKESPLVFDIIT
jgi:hypothetical protein